MQSSADLAAKLASFDQATPNPTDIYNKVTTQLGIPDARTRVQALQTNLINTQNAINAVDPNVTSRTSGSIVTEAQRQRLVNEEKQPLQQTYSTQNQDYGTESTALNNLLSEANTQVSNTQAGYTAQRQSLLDQLSAAQNAEKEAEAQREFNANLALNTQKAASSGSGSGTSSNVNPSQEFLSYIQQQFKATGKNPSRQTQDAWANAWFAAHNVPVSARNAYWNLFNTTYNRPNDPTKDWLYKR